MSNFKIQTASREGVKPLKKPQIASGLNPHWKGGKIVTKDGRVMLHAPNHPRPSKGRYVYRYRLVMEAKLGRYLLPTEIVHHKNGMNNDDREENLEVLGNSDHSSKHAAEQRAKRGWSSDHASCAGCGTTKIRHKGHGLCTRCTDRARWPRRKKL